MSTKFCEPQTKAYQIRDASISMITLLTEIIGLGLLNKIVTHLRLRNFNLRALAITLTEDRDMAAAAIIGESSMPKTG